MKFHCIADRRVGGVVVGGRQTDRQAGHTRARTQKRIEIHLSSGQVSLLFPSPTFNSTCHVWASWKELKEQGCYIAFSEKCAEELCPKYLLVLWTGKLALAWIPYFSHPAHPKTVCYAIIAESRAYRMLG